MPGKPVKTKPSAASMCYSGQWAFNRFLFVLLIVSHSTWGNRIETDWNGPGRRTLIRLTTKAKAGYITLAFNRWRQTYGKPTPFEKEGRHVELGDRPIFTVFHTVSVMVTIVLLSVCIKLLWAMLQDLWHFKICFALMRWRILICQINNILDKTDIPVWFSFSLLFREMYHIRV